MGFGLWDRGACMQSGMKLNEWTTWLWRQERYMIG